MTSDRFRQTIHTVVAIPPILNKNGKVKRPGFFRLVNEDGEHVGPGFCCRKCAARAAKRQGQPWKQVHFQCGVHVMPVVRELPREMKLELVGKDIMVDGIKWGEISDSILLDSHWGPNNTVCREVSIYDAKSGLPVHFEQLVPIWVHYFYKQRSRKNKRERLEAAVLEKVEELIATGLLRAPE